MGELRVEHVPCFLHSEIQGEIIPEIPEGFPFTSRFLDDLLQSCPVVVEIIKDEAEIEPYELRGRAEDSPYGLHRISANHGRSYQVFTGNEQRASKPLAIWGDRNENVYSSLTLKGNNFSHTGIIRSSTAPSGYIPYGLQETDSFLRVVRASRIMSEAGITTEKIIRVVEPKVFRAQAFDTESDLPIEGEYEYVALPEYKRRLLIQHWGRISEKDDAFEEFSNASKAINEMSFFVTLRAMSIGNRIMDFCGPKSEFVAQLEHTFDVMEPLFEHKEGEAPLNVENKENIEWFCTYFLPSAIGYNLAKLHNLGLMHTFPTTGNINAFGDLVDLDSVKGEPLGLGDAKLTEEDFFKDVRYILCDTDNRLEMERFANNFIKLMGPDYRQKNEDNEVDDELLGTVDAQDRFINIFTATFIDNYIRWRFELEEEASLSDDNVLGLLKFIGLELRDGEGLRYDGYFKLILENQLTASDYEVLLEEELIGPFSESFLAWGKENTLDNTRNAVMNEVAIQNADNLDNNAQLELAVFYGSLREISRTERIKLHNDATVFIEAREFTKKIEAWLDTHIKPDATLSRNAISSMVVYGLRERLVSMVYERVRSDPTNPNHYISFFTEPVAPDLNLDGECNAQVHGFFLNGVVANIWSGINLDVLVSAIRPRGAITLIRHDDLSLGGKVTIESTKDMKLQQIFHSGGLINDLHIDEAEEFGEGGVLSFEPKGNDEYVAWTRLNKDANELHLYIARKI